MIVSDVFDLLAKPYRKLDLARMLRIALTSAGILQEAKPAAVQ